MISTACTAGKRRKGTIGKRRKREWHRKRERELEQTALLQFLPPKAILSISIAAAPSSMQHVLRRTNYHRHPLSQHHPLPAKGRPPPAGMAKDNPVKYYIIQVLIIDGNKGNDT